MAHDTIGNKKKFRIRNSDCKKGLLSILMLLLFSIAQVGSAVSQTYSGGSGTAEDPWQIATVEDLQAVNDNLDDYFIQTADIDASDSENWNDGEGFAPIGGVFDGVFDGNGYTITGLYINRPETNPVGMFRRVNGVLTNIQILNADITGESQVGILAGDTDNGARIEYCHTSGHVTGTWQETGGLIGYVRNNDDVVFRSSSSATVVAEAARPHTGGLIGRNRGEIEESFANGQVIASEGEHVGGLVGTHESGALIKNSYATASVHSGHRLAGGLVGRAIASEIEYSFSSGEVTGTTNFTGGFVGNLDNDATAIGSYFDTESSGFEDGSGGTEGDITGLLTDEMTGENAALNMGALDFDQTWSTTENYPELTWVIGFPPQIAAFSLLTPEDGTELLVEGQPGDQIVATWQNPDYDGDPELFFTWHLDAREADFSSPIFSAPADEFGQSNQITLTLGAVDSILAANGVDVGEIFQADWTVTAEAGDSVRFANSAFQIDIERGIVEEIIVVEYRSATEDGAWSDASSWENLDTETDNWIPAVDVPSSTDQITIQQGHHLKIAADVDVIIEQLLTIYGKITVQGSGAEGGSLSALEPGLIIVEGGTYEHARNGGSFPTATWGEGATLLVTGMTGSLPGNRNQNYHHVVWNSPGQSGNANLELGNNRVISGDLNLINLGGNQLRLTNSQGPNEEGRVMEEDWVIDILGNVTVGEADSRDAFKATSHWRTKGNYIINIGGHLHILNNSVLSPSHDEGRAIINIGGDFIIDGGGVRDKQNDNMTDIVFVGSEPQRLRLSELSEIDGTINYNFIVAEGAILDKGNTIIHDEMPYGSFKLNDGAGISTSHVDGLGGNFNNPWLDLTFSEKAIYIFNGIEAQVTSETMPSTVASLVIDNGAGVELSAPVTITGTLELLSGVFYNGYPVVLGDEAELIIVDGSLAYPLDQEIFQAELLAEQEGFDDYFKVVEAEDGDGPYAYVESISESPDRDDPPADGWFAIPTGLRGEVNIWLLVNMAGPSSDSFFLGFGDNSRERWWFNYEDHDADYGTWVWALYSDVTGTNTGPFVASDGNDTLYITRRETEAKLDRVLFTTDLDFVPEDPDRPKIYPPANQLVQAESAADQDGFDDFFEVVQSEHGYTYIQAIADAPGFADAPEDGYLTYTTTLNGPLNIWLLVNMPDPDSDSFFIGYDENSVERWWFNYEDHEADYGTWVWALYEDVTGTNTDAFAATGENTLYITRRQAGARLDQILFSTDPDFVPMDPDRPTDTSGDQELVVEVPDRTELMGNYPNPFNPTTTLSYALDSDQHVTITIYNTLGERVATVVDQVVSAGTHTVQFDASRLASGLYLYRMHAQGSGVVQTRKMMLVK